MQSARYGACRPTAGMLRRLAMLLLFCAQWPLLQAAPTPDPLPERLVVAVIGNAEPLEGVESGRPSGFSGELLRALLEGSNTRLELRHYARRNDSMRALCRGEVDLVLAAVPLPSYSHCLIYSSGYIERSALVVMRKDDGRTVDNDFLRHAKALVVAGSPWEEELPLHYPGIQVRTVAGIPDGLQQLTEAKADLFIGTSTRLSRVLHEGAYDSLTGLRRMDIGSTVFRFAANSADSDLIHELDRRLALIPNSTIENLRDKWLNSAGEDSPRFVLSAAERKLLAQYRRINYTVPAQILPFAMEDAQGKLDGLTADYLNALQHLLGIEFVYRPSRDMSEALGRLSRGEVGVLAGSLAERDVNDGLQSMGTFASVPMVIVTLASAPYTASLEMIRGRKVAVIASGPMADTIRRQLPNTYLVEVADFRQAFELLRSNQVDAMLGNLTTMDALVRSDAGRDLRIAGAAGFDQHFDIWLPNRLAPLFPVFKRALASIPELERTRLAQRWTAQYRFDSTWPVLLARYWPLLASAGLAILVLAAGYLRLRHQVRLRRETEGRLADELALKEALLGCLPQAIAAKDPSQRYVAMNPAFETFFGVNKADFVGKALRVRTTPYQSIDALLRLQREAYRAMAARNLTLPLVNAAGEQRTVIAWAVPYPTRDGALGGIVTMYLDVTDIQATRQRALSVEQQLKAVTESLPAVVFQIRRKAKAAQWKVAYLAGNMNSIAPLDARELLEVGASDQWIFHPDDCCRLCLALEQNDEPAQPVELELRLSEALGGGWVQISAVPKREGADWVWNGVMSDVTERHRQARALREAKEAAEAALCAKESFLAMMSHEIRTPMNGVLGLVEVLQNSPLTNEQQRLLALAKESGQSLAQVLDDILDYAKIEAGRLSITPEPLDLRSLLDSVLSLLLPQAHNKGLQISNCVEAEVPASVHADGIRVRQILFNLFGNSIKFTDRGGVRLHTCVESMDEESAVVLVTVEDSGIGIPKADIQRLFAPFVQSERSSNRRFGGTGLGLSISRRLAEMMGGQLILESEEGVGTIASLRIPCSVLQWQYELPALQGREVLLEVADPNTRHGLAHFASAAGMRVGELAEAAADAICFVDDELRERVPAGRPMVQISRVPKQLGFVVVDGVTRLSVNPLRWTAFLAATESVSGGEPAAEASAMFSKGVAARVSLLCAKVLVVEDHPINREVIRQQLQLLGCQSSSVENGSEALALLQHESFDALLTDCHMPVMNGFELTAAIRNSADERLRRLPVVGVTATTVREELERCLEVGMNAYVLKPTTLERLRQALEMAQQSQRMALDEGAMDEPGQATQELPGLDWDSLQASLAEVCADTQLRELFAKAMAEDRERLRACLASGSQADLRAWCHRSSGAMATLGDPALDELFAQFQQAVRNGRAERMQALSPVLLELYGRLLALFGQPQDEGVHEGR